VRACACTCGDSWPQCIYIRGTYAHTHTHSLSLSLTLSHACSLTQTHTHTKGGEFDLVRISHKIKLADIHNSQCPGNGERARARARARERERERERERARLGERTCVCVCTYVYISRTYNLVCTCINAHTYIHKRAYVCAHPWIYARQGKKIRVPGTHST
jgi:hypothetical protein